MRIINDHDLVMGDGHFIIDQNRDPLIDQEGGGTIALLLVGFVEQNPYIDTAPLGLRQRLHDRLAGQAIGLDQNPRSGMVHLIHKYPRAILTGSETCPDFSRPRK